MATPASIKDEDQYEAPTQGAPPQKRAAGRKGGKATVRLSCCNSRVTVAQGCPAADW